MSFNKPLTSVLTGCLFCSGVIATQAETIEKTTTTTTVQSTAEPVVQPTPVAAPVAAFVLPARTNYLVVDGRTGVVMGSYDIATKSIEGGQPLPVGALIVEKNSGRLVATVDALGSIVDIYAIPATQVLSTTIVDTRTHLYKLIAEAYDTNAINKEQAAAMRAELDKIAAETAANSPSLTYGQALLIGYNLDLLSDRLVPIVTSAQPIVPVVPPEFIVVGGHLSMVDKFTYRQTALERRIDNEYKAGRLTSGEVSRLKSQLDQVASLGSKYRGNNGQLSSSQQRKLVMRLNAVQTSLDSDVSSTNKKRSQLGLIVD
jgi:hypothetical protein